MDSSTDHIKALGGWILHDPVKERVKDSVLYNFVQNLTPFKLDHGLIAELLKSYDKEKGCFVINDKEIRLGLKDVFYLTGLPIVGKPVIANCENCYDAVKDICSLVSEKNFIISLKDLRVEYNKFPKDEQEIQNYMCCYYLYIIGCAILPSPGKLEVDGKFLLVIKDLNSVNNYAWGAAMLSYLHAGLAHAKDCLEANNSRKGPTLFGSSTLLQLFFIARGGKILHKFYGLNSIPYSFPLMNQLSKGIAKKCNNTWHKVVSDVKLEAAQFDERPYDDVLVPQHLAFQAHMWELSMPLLCFKKVFYYRAELYSDDQSLSEGHRFTRGNRTLYTSDRGTLVNLLEKKDYKERIRRWNECCEEVLRVSASSSTLVAVGPIEEVTILGNEEQDHHVNEEEEEEAVAASVTTVAAAADEEQQEEEVVAAAVNPVAAAVKPVAAVRYYAQKQKRDESLKDYTGATTVTNTVECGNKKLLILDLNGVLIISKFREPSIRRPFVIEFLQLCLQHFSLAIWSSKRNIKDDCTQLEKDMGGKFLFCWNQYKCTKSEEKVLHNKQKEIMFKDLRKVWKDHSEFDESNTVLIDDSAYKSYLNPDHTIIIPKTFTSEKDDNYLAPEGDFAKNLVKLAKAENTKEYIKNNPFGEPDIQDESTRKYYKDAAQKFREDVPKRRRVTFQIPS